MNIIRVILVILFVVSCIYVYLSATNSIVTQKDQVSASIVYNDDRNEVVIEDTYDIGQHKQEKREKRKKISSYEQNTNNSYEQNKVINKSVIGPALKPYTPEIFGDLSYSLV